MQQSPKKPYLRDESCQILTIYSLNNKYTMFFRKILLQIANLCYYMYKHNFTDEWTNDDFIWCYFESRASKSSGPESLWFERLLANNDVHKPVTPDAKKRNIYIFNEEEYGKELDNYLRKDYKMSSNLELKPKDFFE